MENQNEKERRRIEGNHNEEGLDSQANRMTRTPEETCIEWRASFAT